MGFDIRMCMEEILSGKHIVGLGNFLQFVDNKEL